MGKWILGLMLVIYLALLPLLAAARLIAPSLNAGRVAFETDRDGNWEIYMLDVRTGLAVNLTRSPGDDRAPSWSPDGREIVFHSNRAGGDDIYRIRTDSRDVTRITVTHRDWRPRWSPDGRLVLFTRDFNGIYIMQPDGSDVRYVTTGFGAEWSPDSQHIVYYFNQGSRLHADIYLTALDSPRQINLTNSRDHEWGPVWLPDGHSIAYVSTRSGVHVLDTACANVNLADCIQPFSANIALTQPPRWSPDGQQIIFEALAGAKSHLFIINANGSQLRPVATAGNSQSPAWSP